jgi:hypothetical protein
MNENTRPDTGYSHAYQDDLHPNIDAELALQQQQPNDQAYDPIKVEIVGGPENVDQGSYQTIVIPASTANVPAVVQLLGHDPTRGYAYVMPVDYPIVISTNREEAQQALNVGGTYPNGGYIGTGFSPPIRHKEPLFAANTSTAGTCRVVVIVERGNNV